MKPKKHKFDFVLAPKLRGTSLHVRADHLWFSHVFLGNYGETMPDHRQRETLTSLCVILYHRRTSRPYFWREWHQDFNFSIGQHHQTVSENKLKIIDLCNLCSSC